MDNLLAIELPPRKLTGLERQIALAGYSAAHSPDPGEGGKNVIIGLVIRQFDRHGGKPSYVNDIPGNRRR